MSALGGMINPEKNQEGPKPQHWTENQEIYEKKIMQPKEETQREDVQEELNTYDIISEPPVPVIEKCVVASSEEAKAKYTSDRTALTIGLPGGELLVVKLVEDVINIPRIKKDNNNLKVENEKLTKQYQASRLTIDAMKQANDELQTENSELKIKAGILERLDPLLKNIFESTKISVKAKKQTRRK